MTHLPDCPRCGEDDLWLLSNLPESWRTRCYECGYDSGAHELAAGQDLASAIAAVVAEDAVYFAERDKQG